ncbi:MAG: hypothetical protein K9G58_06615 [Bacteroidales bacterium]|nr:hypothetical protein [Bacteroidales bacterium]MCF8388735.1 hypothetical protein [Bacteroidales bacterium]MCF8397821.1 hypothetical protein [Bacteroidales bacterium]
MKKKEEKNYKSSPLSIYFRNLNRYKSSWTIEEILVFEKFLFLFREFGQKEFYYQNKRLEKELHIKRTKRESAMNSLFDKGFIIVSNNKGTNGKNLYSIDIKKIIESLDDIYHFEEYDQNPEILKQVKHNKAEFLKHYVTKGQPSPKKIKLVKKGKNEKK